MGQRVEAQGQLLRLVERQPDRLRQRRARLLDRQPRLVRLPVGDGVALLRRQHLGHADRAQRQAPLPQGAFFALQFQRFAREGRQPLGVEQRPVTVAHPAMHLPCGLRGAFQRFELLRLDHLGQRLAAVLADQPVADQRVERDADGPR